MSNNNILRSLCKIFDFNHEKIVEVLTLIDYEISVERVEKWFKKPSDSSYVICEDEEMASFLNGLICYKRGKKDGPQPVPEKSITNNIILKKLKIAMNFKNEDILEILESAGVTMNSYELTAFFRKEGHKNYRQLKDTELRSVLVGLEIKKSQPESQS